MNTTEVVINLARKLNISQASARTLLRDRLSLWSQTLSKQEAVELPGLGTLETEQTKVRRQYIPGKHCFCLIPAHKRAHFTISTLFKARLRRQGP